MLYVLWGADDFSLSEALDKIKEGVGDPEALATNLTVLEGPEATVDRLRSVCEAAPFLAEKRIVIVNGLLARCQPQGRPRRTRAKKRDAAADDALPLAEYMATIPESTILVLVDGAVRGDNPLLKLLSGTAEVRAFPLLRDAALKQWLQSRVQRAGGTVSSGAVDLLVRLIGSDLRVMAGEVDKLALYAAGRKIEEEDVRLLVGHTQQTSVFALMDAIVEFRPKAAELLLHRMIQQGATPTYLLAMLTRQLRLIVLAKEVGTPRMSAADLRGRLGLTSEFVARKAMEQARSYTMPRLSGIYRQILDADLAIKTGRLDAELALHVLVAELCQPMPARVPNG